MANICQLVGGELAGGGAIPSIKQHFTTFLSPAGSLAGQMPAGRPAAESDRSAPPDEICLVDFHPSLGLEF